MPINIIIQVAPNNKKFSEASQKTINRQQLSTTILYVYTNI